MQAFRVEFNEGGSMFYAEVSEQEHASLTAYTQWLNGMLPGDVRLAPQQPQKILNGHIIGANTLRLLRGIHFIDAIKVLREITGANLKESKDFADLHVPR